MECNLHSSSRTSCRPRRLFNFLFTINKNVKLHQLLANCYNLLLSFYQLRGSNGRKLSRANSRQIRCARLAQIMFRIRIIRDLCNVEGARPIEIKRMNTLLQFFRNHLDVECEKTAFNSKQKYQKLVS